MGPWKPHPQSARGAADFGILNGKGMHVPLTYRHNSCTVYWNGSGVIEDSATTRLYRWIAKQPAASSTMSGSLVMTLYQHMGVKKFIANPLVAFYVLVCV